MLGQVKEFKKVKEVRKGFAYTVVIFVSALY